MTTSNCRPDYPPLPQQVTSARLIIRPSRRSDAPYLKAWWNDPTVTEPGGNVDGMQYDDGDMDDWFQRYIDERDCASHFVICVLATPTERPIGEFYIGSDDRPGCVGVALIIGDTSVWGNGYAAEALGAYAQALFDSGLCEAVRMDMRVDNERAIRMCHKVGFEVELVWANGLFQTMILTHAAFELLKFKTESQADSQ